MTKDTALQTLATIINRAVFSGTLVDVAKIGRQAQEALVSDTSVTMVINGTTYKLLARA